MSVRFTAEQRAFQETAQRFAREKLAPHYQAREASGEVDRAANRARATVETGRLGGGVVPVLYSNLAGNRLFAGDGAAAAATATAAPAAADVATIQKRLAGELMTDYITPVGGGYWFVPPGTGGGRFGWIGESLLS